MRRDRHELADEALEDLRAALEEIGLVSVVSDSDDVTADLVLEIGKNIVAVEVKPVVATSDAQRIVDLARPQRLPLLVAAERISDGARLALRDAGVSYFDRRGRLRLVLPGVFVDAEVSGSAPHSTRSAPLSSETAKEVAILLLGDPNAAPGVREIARVLDRSPSTVSAALDGLRAAGLVTSANEPLVPDLFWELEAVWRREPVALAELPQPGDARRSDPLQLGLGHDDVDGWALDSAGWALTDTLGAVAWGMPIVASGAYPPDFYVPSSTVLSRALSTYGRAVRPDERACTVALPPARIVCRRRVSRDGETWPVASHIVVALDIAKDRARGRETLERWEPQGLTRVW